MVPCPARFRPRGLASAVAPAVGMGTLSRFGPVVLWAGLFVLCVIVSVGHLTLAPRLQKLRLARIAAGS